MIGLAQDSPLAVAQYSCFGPHGVMGIFKAYLDGSGTKDDPHDTVLIVAGYVAHADSWTAFEDDWRAALVPFGIPALHMKDFAHFNGDFKGWPDSKRRDLLGVLAPIIGRHSVRGFSVGVDLLAYRQAGSMFQLPRSLRPYPLAASRAVAAVEQWAASCGAGRVDYKLEHGDDDQGHVDEALDYFGVKLPAYPQRICKSWTDENGDTNWCYPFQAADFLAYEHSLVVDEQRDGTFDGEPRRGSLRLLLRATDAHQKTECIYYGMKDYVETCIDRRIPSLS